MASTWRATQKANRREELMRAAATLFADRGFAAVSISEIGDAIGVTGPALYRHFASKDALLAEILVDASERLLAGALGIVDEGGEADAVLNRLIDFHIEFATTDPEIIRLQDHELAQLPRDANHRVRELQRRYVQQWDDALTSLRRDLGAGERETRLLALFGLLNSTPYSVRAETFEAAAVLRAMAVRALLGDRQA